MLRAIERATRQVIEPMNLPSVDAVNALRITKFKQRVTDSVAAGDSRAFRSVIEQLEQESGLPLIDIAAALAHLAQGTSPLLLAGPKQPDAAAPEKHPVPDKRSVADKRPAAAESAPARGFLETFRIEVGSQHGIRPGNIVGAIANEAGIEGVHIGRVDIREEYSYVDLPEGMPTQVFKDLQKVRVAGRELRISRVKAKAPAPRRPPAGRPERKVLRRVVKR
jgi:ATP-dependent RNA helicase DeaD